MRKNRNIISIVIHIIGESNFVKQYLLNKIVLTYILLSDQVHWKEIK
jgi:hypothetical protein